jgi:hypothetical protein
LHHPGNRIYRGLIEAIAATSNRNTNIEFAKEIVHVMQMQNDRDSFHPLIRPLCRLSGKKSVTTQNNINKKSKAKSSKSQKSLHMMLSRRGSSTSQGH